MPGIYKTPGVYVEEISKFPPSIAPVETAIPAFIGYTEKAEKNGESLTLTPIRIESIAEYEAYFGGAPPQDVTVWLNSDNEFVKSAANANRFLYDSLRMFYANGGGKCYIVSIGNYSITTDKQHFLDGLNKLLLEDEPTILVWPDAAGLGGTDLYDIQVEGLMQCARLMDRVVVCDLKHSADFGTNVQEFRDRVGINNLKYGAAYGPWMTVSLPRRLLRRNIILQNADTNALISLGNLTTDAKIISLLDDLMLAENAITTAKQAETTIAATGLDATLKSLLDGYNSGTDSTAVGQINLITDLVIDVLTAIEDARTSAPVPANSRFKIADDIDNYLNGSGIKGTLQKMADHHNALGSLTSPITLIGHTGLGQAETFFGFDTTTLADATVPAAYAGIATSRARCNVAIPHVLSAANAAIGMFRFVQSATAEYEKSLNDALLASYGFYKQLVSKASDALNLLPPSGAIAGVYASVDRDRGVWKAPANVSLNAVVAPAVKISHEDQAEYNVDVNAGKSINIIRSFTGKGTLVWGARTLAGNDNEWRYISVRRFFNFVEESVKKATEQFVFEPNDANTWVRVQAMIENFLNTLWRQGALQGIKPEHAYYVAVGLGKTMTSLDILEGRMIIEIGMAAVRPAEFIILRFSHKMAES